MNPAPRRPQVIKRRAVLAILLFVLLFEGAYLAQLKNTLGNFTDPHSEADSIRSAEAYIRDGLSSHHGLPRILYGHRFPKDGTVKDHVGEDGLVPEEFRQGFPPEQADPNQWVYTHYPPGPNLLLGALATITGLENLQVLRVVPVVIAVLSLMVLINVMCSMWGVKPAAVVGGAIAVLPTVLLMMPGLHYESYALSLVWLQLAVLILIFWGDGRMRAKHCLMLLGLGFAQGWLSFDFFFIVSLLALPMYFLRTELLDGEGSHGVSRFTIGCSIILPAAGFALAHALHLLQVAAELGSMGAAIAELGRTGIERSALDQNYFGQLRGALYRHARLALWFKDPIFGPFLVLVLIVTIPILSGSKSWVRRFVPMVGRRLDPYFVPSKNGFLKTFFFALVVSTAWVVVMPQHSVGNAHLTVRHAFVLYFVCASLIALRFRWQPTPGHAG